MQEELVKLAGQAGYDKFHPLWFENNKLEPKSWYIECCLLNQWFRQQLGIILWVSPMQLTVAERSGHRFTWEFIYHGDSRFDKTPMAYATPEEALEQGIKAVLIYIVNEHSTVQRG
jgi:hypothetical protein